MIDWRFGPAGLAGGIARGARLSAGTALLAAAFGLPAARPAFAALPEVPNVRLDPDEVTLSWDALAGAAGYHVYRGDVADLAGGDAGVCLIGSLPGTSGQDADLPAVGQAFGYLIAAFDPSGEGDLGSGSDGQPREVSARCTPKRRNFSLIINDDNGDDITGGTEPRQNPSVVLDQSLREITGVSGHSGEFSLVAADHDTEQTYRYELLPSGDTACSPGPISSGNTGHNNGINPNNPPSAPTAGLRVRPGPNAAGSAPARRWCFSIRATDTGGDTRWFRGDARRTYRSQIAYDGPLGHNWELGANARLEASGANVLYFDGTGRREVFTAGTAGSFLSPAGLYSVLVRNMDDSFTLRDPNGTLHEFHALDSSNLFGALMAVEDRSGNRMSLLYDHQGLLTTIVDTLGRTRAFTYDADGRIVSLSDHAGREVVYSYDARGDLVSVRSPVVTGTPNGNDFPAGKTTSYTYSDGFAEERLNHNLLTVTAPNEFGGGPARITNVYGTNPADISADRVISQTIGGTNASGVPAGGTIAYAYDSFAGPGCPAPATNCHRATVLDRNGNERVLTHDQAGRLVERTERTNRNLRLGEPDYTTRYAYNGDGEIVEMTLPAGNRLLLAYDRPGADRYREGNVLEMRLVADTLASGGRGDGHGGEAADRVWTWTWEPVFNQPASMTEPRGNDPAYVPDNGGAVSPERYRTLFTYDYQEGDPAANGINDLAARFGIVLGGTPFNLGDVNGDDDISQAAGNPLRIERPPAGLLPGSNQEAIEGDGSQDIVTLLEWNEHGQPTAWRDAEDNRHEIFYNPETDPDGDGVATPAPPDGRGLDGMTGGYPRTRVLDVSLSPGRDNNTNPAPVNERHDYEYDALGRLVGLVDGRGVRTGFVRNALGQIVEVRRSEGTADAAGPHGSPPTGRGEPGLAPLGFRLRLEYDANDNVVRSGVEDSDGSRGAGTFVETEYAYDLLDRVVRRTDERTVAGGVTTEYRYDANGNLTRVVQPEGNAHETSYDERDLPLSTTRGASGPRGGTPATRTYEWNAAGNLTRLVTGHGQVVDREYNGFDQPVRLIDAVGSTTEVFYDPAGNIVRSLRRGPVSGPTPPDRSGAANTDLTDVRLLYDELNRPIRLDRLLFVPAGAAPNRPPMIAEGPLVPADGRINRIFEYDALSRLTFDVEDSGATTRYDYDGAGRLLKATDPTGSTKEWTRDGNRNLIETVETEVSSHPGPPPEEFLTTYFYDSLDRPTLGVDNMGNAVRRGYDSLDAHVFESDPLGPPGGSINRRSPGRTGILVPINAHGNVTRYEYDGLSRLIRRMTVLTPSGQGDGTPDPVPDLSNAFNPDGKIVLEFEYDDNSLPSLRRDDRGNETAYAYDNLNRRLSATAPDVTARSVVYDAEDNIVTYTDANGSIVTNSWDAADRLVQTSVNRAAGVGGTTLQTYQYDGLSRLTRATDDNEPGDMADDTTVVRFYDSLGRLIEESQSLSGVMGASLVDFGYQAADRMTDLTYPDGRRLQYSYDAADRLVSVSTFGGPESAQYRRFGRWRVHTRTFNNNLRSTRLDDAGVADIGYDGLRRTVLLRHLIGPALLAGFENTYDGLGSMLSERRQHHGAGGGSLVGTLTGYDSARRPIRNQEGPLSSALTFTGPPTDEQFWTLDGAGNWPRMTRAGQVYRATPNNNNEYDEPQSGGTRVDDGVPDDFLDLDATPGPDGLNFAHDRSGNRTNLGRFSPRYDAFNRMVSATRNSDGAQVARYAWDALGRRVRRQVMASGPLDETRRYLYAPRADEYAAREIQAWLLTHETLHALGSAHVIEERDAANQRVRLIAYGPPAPYQPGLPPRPERLWQIPFPGGVPGPPQYFLEDARGSMAAIATNVVQERVIYSAYGTPYFLDAANQPLRDGSNNFIPRSQQGYTDLWLGMRYDPETSSRTPQRETDLPGLFTIPPPAFEPFLHGVGGIGTTILGPAGEEIQTDSSGRVKVRFHWDREGSHLEDGTFWSRLVTPMAGSTRGFHFLPEVNDEVIVGFQSGDPDQPIVTGRLHDPSALPPYLLPPEERILPALRAPSLPPEPLMETVTGGLNATDVIRFPPLLDRDFPAPFELTWPQLGTIPGRGSTTITGPDDPLPDFVVPPYTPPPNIYIPNEGRTGTRDPSGGWSDDFKAGNPYIITGPSDNTIFIEIPKKTPPPPARLHGCGMIGIEPLLFLGFLAWLKRLARRRAAAEGGAS